MSTTGGMRSHSSAWIAAFFVAGMSMAASPASHAEPVSAALDGPGDAAGVAVAFDARPTVPVWAAHGGAPGVPPARMPGSGEADGTSGRATQAYEGGSTLLARIPFIPLVEFSVTNASRLAASAFAFDNLAGPMPGFPSDPSLPAFDWGLPFFFGRTVFTAIEARSTPAGVGPYLAF